MRIWLVIDALCRAAKRPSRRGLRRVAVSCRPAAAVPSAGHPVLTRARAILGALDATPGRPGTAHPDVNIVASAAQEPKHVGGRSPDLRRAGLCPRRLLIFGCRKTHRQPTTHQNIV